MQNRAEPRSIVVSIRLTPFEAAHIETAGKALNQPRRRSDFVRAAALHAARAKVPPPAKPIRRPARRLPAHDTRLLAQILGQVGHIGGNINQIARKANSVGATPAVAEIKNLIAEICAIREAIMDALHGEERP